MLIFSVIFLSTVFLTECVTVCPTFKDYYTQYFNKNCYDNPDAESDDPSEVISRWGYYVKNYNITTPDGYIISVEKLYRKNDKKLKTPIILGPGISMNSMAFIDRGNKSLAFFLADQGYIVWVINWRGTRFSRGHIDLTPKDRQYWNIGFNKMAVFDLKSVLNRVYEETKRKSIYIGFSMGTTISLIYNMKEQKSAEKTLKNIIHLAPVTKMDHSRSLLKYLNPLWPLAKPIVLKLWNGELFPYKKRKRSISLCSPFPIQMKFCELLNFPIFGSNLNQMDPLTYPVTSRQNKDSIAVGTVDHYSQIISSKKFQEYNHGLIGNIKEYKSLKPPLYNIKKLTIPQTMFVGTKDIIATHKDTKSFYESLPKKSRCGYYLIKNFNHRDFIGAKNVMENVYYKILYIVNQLDSGQCKQYNFK